MSMKKYLAGLLALLLAALPLFSGLAAITAEDYAAAVQHFTSVFEKTGVIGAGVLVNQGGERIFECYYGYGNWAHDRAVDADTVYKVASVSKHIAAIGMMRLYDQGLIDLDAPITSESGKAIANPYYPDRPINLRQVMSHTSSFRDDAPYFGYIQWDLNDLQNNTIFTGSAPGARFVYSNLNGGIINSMIERVTGQNFNRYMTENVFTPLGINASYASYLLPDPSTISNTYYADGNVYRSANKFLEDDAWDSETTCDPFRHYSVAAGSCYISLAGLEKIGRMMAGMGEVDGVRILSEDTVRLMMTDQSTIPGSGVTFQSPYGLCVCRFQSGGYMWYGHQGRLEGLMVDVFMEPETQTVIVYVMNGVGGANGQEVAYWAQQAIAYVEAWMMPAP